MEANNPEPSQPPEAVTRGRGSGLWMILLIVVAIVAVVVVRILKHETPANTESAAPVTVAAIPVTREDLFNELTIPGEFRPYQEVELHAKVSGYVDQIKVDFGDKVKAGQLLATLEVPELRDELHNSMAMQQRAEVDFTNTHVIYGRLKEVNQRHAELVAQQDLDTALSKDGAAAAAVAAARADVEKYETMEKYTRIVAPFDGVITRRYADAGTLIQSGTASDTQSLPLVRVSDNYHLRLDFPVSVKYVKDIKFGDSVRVRVDSLGGKSFTGTIARFTSKVSEDTRTMITEVELENPDLEAVPGMYAIVVIEVDRRPGVLAVPTQAVSGEKNPTVYVVNQNHEIESREVKLGVETPEKYEVISGLKDGELVMIGNRTAVRPGQKVETKLLEPRTAP